MAKLTPITEPRFFYKPTDGFEYPRYFDAFTKCLTSVWNPLEVDMNTDVLDWEKALVTEREIIGGILRGFTQIECVIGDYWREVVTNIFPKPEIISMCNAFSFFESLHAFAYNHLSSTLDLDEYTAYYGDELAQKKINYLLDEVNGMSDKVKLAVFSGCAEGVALFSSFSVLLSFSKDGRFKGLAQIISWSIIDETQHSEEGGALFKELVALEPLTDGEIKSIKEGFQAVVDNELAFLDNVFGDLTHINGIHKNSFVDFIKERATERAANLGLGEHISWEYDKAKAFEVGEWFYPLSTGNISQDFFAHSKEGSLYIAKPTFDKAKIDWEEIDRIHTKKLFA